MSNIKNIVCLLMGIITLIHCNSFVTKSEGEVLAEQHCQSCHLMPLPEDIDRSVWQEQILPDMGARLNPESITSDEWDKLKEYFVSNAPLAMPIDKKRKRTIIDTSLFEVFIPEFGDHSAFTSMVKIDEKDQSIFYGNSKNHSVYILNADGSRKDSFGIPGTPMTLNKSVGNYHILTMGNFMPEGDAESLYGSISQQKNRNEKAKMIISKLPRAVDALSTDLNMDGKEDVIISCFGFTRFTPGELAWYDDINGVATKHILNTYQGMTKTLVYDVNKDGLPDIFALAAQGDERVLLYENQGNGQFKESVLLRFRPSYGSTYFELIDANNDGLMDILYVNGDNGDYDPIPKNYHGIRIFEGQKDGGYKEALFLPMHGVYKAIAADFDQDQDLDIAAISYFPDYKNRPEEAFVYFENKGRSKYERTTVSASILGKWLVMDAGDIDGDGDKDIVLGSAFFQTEDVPDKRKVIWMNQSVPLLILKNKTKK